MCFSQSPTPKYKFVTVVIQSDRHSFHRPTCQWVYAHTCPSKSLLLSKSIALFVLGVAGKSSAVFSTGAFLSKLWRSHLWDHCTKSTQDCKHVHEKLFHARIYWSIKDSTYQHTPITHIVVAFTLQRFVKCFCTPNVINPHCLFVLWHRAFKLDDTVKT